MTAPAGLTRLAPPPSLLSPAPSATLSPPLSEPEQRADSGGNLKFFGRDGHVLLELSHGPADAWEKEKRWVVVAKKPLWLPPTVAAPVGSITAHAADGQSSQHSPCTSGRVRRKQQAPGHRQAGPVFCGDRCRPPPAAGRLCGASLRRLSRRPCHGPQPAGGAEQAPPAQWPAAAPALSPATRAARLADAVRRLAERRQRVAARTPRAARTEAAAARPTTPRKRSHAAGRTPRAAPRSSPAASAAAAAVHRQSTVHSIDSLLAAPSRAAPPPPPLPAAPLVVPTPLRPAPPSYAPYAAYLSGYGGELCVVPPPAGCAPFPLVSPLLYAQLSGAAAGRRPAPLPPARSRPSPAHAAGRYTSAYDYSQYTDEPLDLSKR